MMNTVSLDDFDYKRNTPSPTASTIKLLPSDLLYNNNNTAVPIQHNCSTIHNQNNHHYHKPQINTSELITDFNL